MDQLKTQIINSSPISRQNVSSFQNVDENTQGSVKMQNEIEYSTSFYTTQKRLISNLITNKIHNQKDTNLCASISVLSALRAGQVLYLVNKGKLVRPKRCPSSLQNYTISILECLDVGSCSVKKSSYTI